MIYEQKFFNIFFYFEQEIPAAAAPTFSPFKSRVHRVQSRVFEHHVFLSLKKEVPRLLAGKILEFWSIYKTQCFLW